MKWLLLVGFVSVASSGPVCILMRGLPGSGKSTLAKELATKYEDAHIVSTDQQFMVDGKYVFDRSRLKEAHEKTQQIALELFQRGAKCVIIDNCNVSRESMRPYITAAKERGYRVLFVEPETPWKDSIEECMKRTIHGVPREDMERMKGLWEVAD